MTIGNVVPTWELVFIERGREIKLTPIVDVGLKAILMFMISPFDIPPCKPT